MLIYHYNGTTKEFVTSNKAVNDPRAGKPMIPANATMVKPPKTGDEEIAVFDIVTETWSIAEDFKGVYYDEFGTPEVVRESGKKPKTGSTKAKPPEKQWFYQIQGKKWVLKSLEDIKQLKINEAHSNSSIEMGKLTSIYSQVEIATWSPLYTECMEYRNSGTVGLLMGKKITASNVYDTADKLADRIITDYDAYLNSIFEIQTQRDTHKININQMAKKKQLMDYDSTVSL